VKRISLIGFALLVLLVPAVNAQTGTCFLSTVALNFGQYDPLSSLPLDINGSLGVDCRPPHFAEVPHPMIYRVELSAGLNSSGIFIPRQQLNAVDASFLDYNLYLDSGRSQVWGDGTGSTFELVSQGDTRGHHHSLPDQAKCHGHAAGATEDHELGGCHDHIDPKFVRKFHTRVEGEKHEHPTGQYHHHDFVSTVIIYGRIFAQQTSVTPGTYTDTITVTIFF